jgi:hypothetical protein
MIDAADNAGFKFLLPVEKLMLNAHSPRSPGSQCKRSKDIGIRNHMQAGKKSGSPSHWRSVVSE